MTVCADLAQKRPTVFAASASTPSRSMWSYGTRPTCSVRISNSRTCCPRKGERGDGTGVQVAMRVHDVGLLKLATQHPQEGRREEGYGIPSRSSRVLTAGTRMRRYERDGSDAFPPIPELTTVTL